MLSPRLSSKMAGSATPWITLPPQQRVVLLGFPDALGLLHRVDPQALVGAAGAAVQLLDPVQPPFLVHRVPQKGWKGKKKVTPTQWAGLGDAEDDGVEPKAPGR